MWDPPRPGLEPVSPASAGRFSTTAPSGKPPDLLFLFILIHFLSFFFPESTCPSWFQRTSSNVQVNSLCIWGKVVQFVSYHLFISANRFHGGKRLGASASTTAKGFGDAHCPFFHQSPFLTSWFSCLSTRLVNERTFTHVTDMSHARLNVHAWPVTVAKSWCFCGGETVSGRSGGGGIWGKETWQWHFKHQEQQGELVIQEAGFYFALGLQNFNLLVEWIKPQTSELCGPFTAGALERAIPFTPSLISFAHTFIGRAWCVVLEIGKEQGMFCVCQRLIAVCQGRYNRFHIRVMRPSSRRALHQTCPYWRPMGIVFVLVMRRQTAGHPWPAEHGLTLS